MQNKPKPGLRVLTRATLEPVKNLIRILGILLSILCFSPGAAFSQGPAAGTIIDLSGQVHIHSRHAKGWKKADRGAVLEQGDAVRTGPESRAAILLADETLLQLSQNSLLQLKAVRTGAGWLRQTRPTPVSDSIPGSIYQLEKGRLWLRNKNKNQAIEILAPFVSTSIRGTELDISIGPDTTVEVSVLEGMIQTANRFGSLTASAMETVIAARDRPLEKQILVSPADSVQWTIPMNSLVDPLMRSIEGLSLADRLQNAYSLMKQRRFQEADHDLARLLTRIPAAAPVWILRSLAALSGGDNDQALGFASRAVELDPQNPYARIVISYALQARFDLDAAMVSTMAALELAPDMVPALVNYGKLLFASGATDAAVNAAEKALALDGSHAEAHNLYGFLMLARRKTGQAIDAFNRAVRLDAGLGEPHLGLALAYMRQARKGPAIEEITTAVLLEPQRSLFLSYWARMLYELERFRQALDILERAEQLDPNDPSPLLIKAHILNDLNRPVQAVLALHKAIALNDNRAVYRSRFLLDQDLALKNVTLARLYRRIGLSEWGGSKARASVKYDFSNSAAHDFLAEEYSYLSGDSSLAARSERLKAFLLKPANQNTLNSFNEYTSFFEQPDISGTLTGFAGNMGYQDIEADIHGALPEYSTAFRVRARRSEQDGCKADDFQTFEQIRSEVKWDISEQNTLSLEVTGETLDAGDLNSRLQHDQASDPYIRSGGDIGDIKLGYCHYLSPDSSTILYVNRRFKNDSYADSHLAGNGSTVLPEVMPGILFDFTYDAYQYQTLEEPFTSFQLLQYYRLRDHQFNAGTVQYWSQRDYRSAWETDYEFFLTSHDTCLFSLTDSQLANSNRTRRLQSYYLQDIWAIRPWLTLEAAVYLDSIDNVNSDCDTAWSHTQLNPRAGLVCRPTTTDTIRASVIRYLDPIDSVTRLDPLDIAGHTMPSFYEGSVIDEASVSWEHEWQSGYLLTRWFYTEPEFDYTVTDAGMETVQNICNTYRGAEIGFNQIVAPGIGFAAGYTFFDIVKDQYTPEMEGKNHWLWAMVTAVHPSGVSIAAGPNYFKTDFSDPSMSDVDFWVINACLEYELPHKRGKLRLECVNLFDEHFDSVALSERAGWIPERIFAVMAELNF